jgi:hypothetical protein
MTPVTVAEIPRAVKIGAIEIGWSIKPGATDIYPDPDRRITVHQRISIHWRIPV